MTQYEKVIYLAIKDASKKMEYADPELAAGDEPFLLSSSVTA